MKVNSIMFLLVLLMSCNKKEEIIPELNACFTSSLEEAKMGETINTTNCSEGFSIFSYYVNDDLMAFNEELSYTFIDGGEHEIRLVVKNSIGKEQSVSQYVDVEFIEDNYYLPEEIINYEYNYVYELGYNHLSDRIYAIERSRLNDDNPSFNIYRSFNSEINNSDSYVFDVGLGGDIFTTSFLDNGIISTIASSGYWHNEFCVRYTNIGEQINSFQRYSTVSYGDFQDEDNFLLYGGNGKNGYIDRLDGNGGLVERIRFPMDDLEVLFTKLEQTQNGFVVTGSVGLLDNSGAYKPMLMLLNSNLEIIATRIFELSEVNLSSSDGFGQAEATDLIVMNNGNIVVNFNEQVIIVDKEFEILKILELPTQEKRVFVGAVPNSLLSLESSFVLAGRDGYVKKFDSNGEFVKEIKIRSYYSTFIKRMINYNDLIVFAAEFGGHRYFDENKEPYYEPTNRGVFYGVMDKELNAINLNNSL